MKLIHKKLDQKPPDQSSAQMSNLDEEFYKETLKDDKGKPGDPYSSSYLWLDLSLMHNFCRKKNSRVRKYIEEKDQIEEKLDIVDLIVAIDTLKTSISNINNEEIAVPKSYEIVDSQSLVKESTKDKRRFFKKRKSDFFGNFSFEHILCIKATKKFGFK